MKKKILLASVISILILSSCILNDGKKLPGQTSYLEETIQYKKIENVKDSLLQLDVYFKDSVTIEPKKPVVIFVHGGNWAIGDKKSQLYGKLEFFFSLDYVFVSTNYRLSPYPFATGNTDRIKFPSHNEDIADAIKWVHDNISKYGGDPNNIGLMGYEAGGHLVALTATNKSFLEAKGLSLDNIKGVAIIDTDAYNVKEQVTSSVDKDIFINAFGEDPAENEKASPMLQLTSGVKYPPICIIKNGAIKARSEAADRFIQLLKDKNAKIFEYDGRSYKTSKKIHSVIGDPMETLLTPGISSFFEYCFGNKTDDSNNKEDETGAIH